MRKYCRHHFINRFLFKSPLIFSLLLLPFLFPLPASAWVYFEHRAIALYAIKMMSAEDRALFEKLWAEARRGYESRLTETIIDTAQGRHPSHLDYASWAAISGDHSCSPENLLFNVLKTDWILNVADISAQLDLNIQESKNNSQRINFLHQSDIRLQRADPEYATRAGSNNVHFLLPRPNVGTERLDYLKECLSPGAALNALGAYAWFHLSAMMKASRYAHENLSPEKKSALILSALADEAFALHFLEDVFAAGHIAGTWGNASLRKGTHDYYNEKGLEVVTWDGQRMVVMGDAYMRPIDREVAAAAVRLSLLQLLQSASGQINMDYTNDPVSNADLPDTFNVCKNTVNPARKADIKFMRTILDETPVPGLANGLGEHPRFRSELGTFLGISSSLNGSTVYGGFGELQTNKGAIASLEMNVRFGFGLEGVLDQNADAQVFFEAGWKRTSASSSQFADSYSGTIPPGTLTSAIPGRGGYNLRLRLPFWLIPGDLLIAGPLLLLFAPKELTKMGVVAANGGLIPWQSSIATGIGSFQFILGREVGVTLYGHESTKDEILVPDKNGTAVFLQYKSTQIDFPIVEYRPFRSFSMNQSSGLIVQITASVDFPHGATLVGPANATIPTLRPVWQTGIRIIFNWRHYF